MYLNQRKIEIFLNKWRAMMDDEIKLEVWTGDKILEAYNYKGGLDLTKFSSSCANFNKDGSGHNVNEYDVYTKNPENIKVLVALFKGRIVGRRMLFEGIQTKTHGKYKEGEKYSILNTYYGEGGYNSKIDQTMKLWAKDNNIDIMDNMYGNRTDIFRININTRFRKYPPFDNMVVNFKTNELASNTPPDERLGWRSAYTAICPTEFLG